MDDNQQQIFAALHSVADEIVTKIEGDLSAAHADINGALDQLRDTNNQLDELRITNRNLSAEMAKLQVTCRSLEDERNFLRGQNSELSATNRKLTAALQTSQDNLSRAQREVDNLRTCLTQIQRFLAG